MTIKDAASKWNVNEKTVLNYILNGYIFDLAIQNNEILLPDIPKPIISKKSSSVNNTDKYILNAINKRGYVNYKILGVSPDEFEERLKALLKSEKIFVRNKEIDDYKTNLNFSLAPSDNRISVNLQISPEIKIADKIDAKIADQIGLINGKVEIG